MEKREINIESKKEVKPVKKLKRKPLAKKIIEINNEKREYVKGRVTVRPEQFNSMNDII